MSHGGWKSHLSFPRPPSWQVAEPGANLENQEMERMRALQSGSALPLNTDDLRAITQPHLCVFN